MTTRTGTVVCVRDRADAVTIAFTVSNAELVDLFAGLAWVDILGGFGAWRMVPPSELTPARIAGQFTLRRTYGEPTAAQEAPTGVGESATGAGVSGEQAGRGGCSAERGTGGEPNGSGGAAAVAVAAVFESAGLAVGAETLGDPDE